MQQIIVAPKGAITEKDKERLSKNNCIVIETDNPESVKLLVPSDNMVGSDLLLSAMHGLTSDLISKEGKVAFVKELHRRLIEREKLTQK